MIAKPRFFEVRVGILQHVIGHSNPYGTGSCMSAKLVPVHMPSG